MAAIPISTDALRMEINAILKNSDLSTTSAKYVQQEIEGKYQVDLSDRKKEIDDLVMEYMQMLEAAKGQKRPSTDGYEDHYNEANKRMKNEYNVGSSYEDWNRSQHQQQASALQHHSTPIHAHHPHMAHSGIAHIIPHGIPHGIPSAMPHGLPTSLQHVMPSGIPTGVPTAASTVPLPKRGGTGFTKVCTLSPELASIVGKDTMARHEVVKKMWSIIKERNLYDPTNKQFAICDEELFKVFGVERFRTFGMMKYLKTHFTN